MSHPILSEFDIIFAGGGTTACVVAGRLAAYDPSLKILILEAGQHSLDKLIYVQPYQHPFNLAPTSTTVTFNIGNPSPHLNGRAPIVACGRCVGGSSCVNAMVYTRVPASDYDDWGVNGWESENLIPLMKKLETYEAQPDCPTHGYDGPIKVSSDGCNVGIGAEFIQVGTTYHKRQYAEGRFGNMQYIQCYCEFWFTYNRYIDGTTGRRSDAAHHYVYNQAHNPNLQVWDGKRVKRIIFEDKRAVGVEFTSDLVSCSDAGQSLNIVRASKLVIVSAGAFGSPTILERSGIGAKAVLEQCGIEQIVDLPGVGENYRDHNMVFVPYLAADEAVTIDALWRGESILQESLAQWNSGGKSLISRNCIDSKIKWRPDDEELKAMDIAFQPRWKEFFQVRPDKAVAAFGVLAGCVPQPGAPARNYMTASYYTLYPASVGSVHIKVTEDGKEGMDFTTGFLDDPSDIVPFDFAYKKTREIFRRMASYRGEITAGHPDFPEGSAAACGGASGPVDLDAPDIVYTAEDDEAINRFHRNVVQTAWHSLGTCAMKSEADQGVVDARLNVYGVSNLKVADMSISPLNVGTVGTEQGVVDAWSDDIHGTRIRRHFSSESVLR
ncbi:alcohol oxidase [Suillus decipiens]|nr:alcohol oxidase [Suillus decipiens]